MNWLLLLVAVGLFMSGCGMGFIAAALFVTRDGAYRWEDEL